MIEDVEKVFQRRVLVRGALEYEFGARNVECAEAAGESEKVDAHLGRRFRLFTRWKIFLAFDLGDVAGREVEFYCRTEVDNLFCRIGALCR